MSLITACLCTGEHHAGQRWRSWWVTGTCMILCFYNPDTRSVHSYTHILLITVVFRCCFWLHVIFVSGCCLSVQSWGCGDWWEIMRFEFICPHALCVSQEAYSVARQFNLIPPVCEQAEYHLFQRDKVEMQLPELYHKIGKNTQIFSKIAFGGPQISFWRPL